MNVVNTHLAGMVCERCQNSYASELVAHSIDHRPITASFCGRMTASAMKAELAVATVICVQCTAVLEDR